MSWEQRGNATYYYRKVRRGNRVVSEYVGRGELAQAIARVDNSTKCRREQARTAARETRTKGDQGIRILLESEKMVQALVRGFLIAQGYHTHKGQWRRKREKGK